jgi:uncharacterized protein YebE (UPF0316 family)
MDTKLLITFIVLNIANVIIQTFKSIVTIKGGKGAAAIINAITFALYTVVTVYMMCDLPLLWKSMIVGLCNLVGVWIVKFLEEKSRKDKLWKVEVTVKKGFSADLLQTELEASDIPFNYIDINKYILFNIYCETQKESQIVKQFINKLDAKYFVSETKNF